MEPSVFPAVGGDAMALGRGGCGDPDPGLSTPVQQPRGILVGLKIKLKIIRPGHSTPFLLPDLGWPHSPSHWHPAGPWG